MRLLRLPVTLLILAYQSMFLAMGQIWNNKVRATLTTIGIVIGVASVTTVIAALTGLKTNVLSEFETFGTNKVFVFPRWQGPRSHINWNTFRFRPELFDKMLDYCPSVERFTRMTSLYGRTISYSGHTEENAQILGIEPDWHKIENRSVIMGRQFSLVDNEQARPVCLINQKTQEKLGLEKDCIGQSILVGERRFRVIGIVESRAESWMFNDNSSGLEVLLPFGVVRRIQPYGGMYVIAACKSPEVSDEAKAELTFYMRKQRRIAPGQMENFGIEVMEQFVRQFNQVASAITMVAGGVVGISLIVGGVGIMNIMLVSVSERTREIGLRKAVGARPSAILLQFLVEAVVLCCFGGLIGVLAGQGLTSAMSSIPAAHLTKAYIPGWAVALSFGFAGAVGLIFGMFPAVKAARLDPIDALRHE
ncbi:MAG: ABC transporter permease [Bacillota bacterium]